MRGEREAKKDDSVPCWSFDTVFSSLLAHKLQVHRSGLLNVMNAVRQFTIFHSGSFFLPLTTLSFPLSLPGVHVHIYTVRVQMRSRTNSMYFFSVEGKGRRKIVGIVNVRMTCTQYFLGYTKRGEWKGKVWDGCERKGREEKFGTNRERCIHEDRQSKSEPGMLLRRMLVRMHEDVQVQNIRTHNSGASIGATVTIHRVTMQWEREWMREWERERKMVWKAWEEDGMKGMRRRRDENKIDDMTWQQKEMDWVERREWKWVGLMMMGDIQSEKGKGWNRMDWIKRERVRERVSEREREKKQCPSHS